MTRLPRTGHQSGKRSYSRLPVAMKYLGILALVQIVTVTIVYLALWLVYPYWQKPLLLVIGLFAVSLFAFVVGYSLLTRVSRRIVQLSQRVEAQLPPAKEDSEFNPTPALIADELDELQDRLHHLETVHAQTVRSLSRRVDRNRILNLIAATINRTFDLQEVFDIALRETLKGVGWDIGALYMWDKRVQVLDMVSYIGIPVDKVRDLFEQTPGDGSVGMSARTQQIVVVADAPRHAKYREHPAAQIARTQITVPLVAATHELLGVLFVGSSSSTDPKEDDINLLVTVANQIALAMDKAELYMRVSRHAEELAKIVEDRTRELEETVDELSVALERAKEADKVKSLLLSTVSHELRTPLATIKGNTSLLQEHHARLAESDIDGHLRDIEEETDKLTELISSLMEMSRIEGGMLHIQREPIDICEVLKNSVEAAQIRLDNSALPHHDIHLQIDRHVPMVLGDARRVEQILANLLDNAAKYSPVDMPIVVSAEVRAIEIVIAVMDRGKGIPEEHIDRIFDRFYQVVERGDAHRQGIGLGLAICKGLVEAHEGRIWVDSEVSIGSTFSFSLPFAVPITAT